MALDPWFKVVTARREVREGRSFNPDEFAIHLEQVVAGDAGNAPDDYKKPDQFFARTCFTRALREHTGMVLRRLSGRTENTAPVLTLVTQFGGGKTHTLATLFHLAKVGPSAAAFTGIPEVLAEAKVAEVPKAAIGAFVGNAWDPRPGRETPWLDLAHQLAGQKGVDALGASAKETPPGTEALGRLFEAAGGTVLILFDEVLNFLNRHRKLAEPFHAFIQNLTVATTGTTRGVAVISLPRSQVEMTDWDQEWQEKITKVVRRVSKDLFANDEAEIAEVIRRRLFENLGDERVVKARRAAARAFAQWCYERRAQLPREWTAVDSTATEKKAQEFLQKRFEDCYPFHPATISVFQRKWQSVSQFQKTRGTLAMLAQWVARAVRDGYKEARREPFITLGSAPLDAPEFRSVVLGQLGESKLDTAIVTDLAGDHAHARALDADTAGPLRDVHRRVGAAILFESSGGQVEKVAHLPELRFAVGEPDLDTTSVDTAAAALEAAAYYIREAGTDGYRIHHKARLKKVVSDRRASLDADGEVAPAVRTLVQKQFEKGNAQPVVLFPADPKDVADSPRLTLVLMGPEHEWTNSEAQRKQLREWTQKRGASPRLYPAALVFCFKKPGRELTEKVETWLAWKRVAADLAKGILGAEYDAAEKAEVQSEVAASEVEARDEVWASYRFIVVADRAEADGVREIDIGAGHASAGTTLAERALAAMKTESLLNESVGAGFLNRNWPPALKEAGAWALTGLRQSFLDGSLTRLPDPDRVLKQKVAEFVERGEFGLASGPLPDGRYQRVWLGEVVPADEVAFETGVFLLTKSKAQELKAGPSRPVTAPPATTPGVVSAVGVVSKPQGVDLAPVPPPPPVVCQPGELRVFGEVPSEQWNRLGTKLLPKLKAAGTPQITIDVRVSVPGGSGGLATEVQQILQDLGLSGSLAIE